MKVTIVQDDQEVTIVTGMGTTGDEVVDIILKSLIVLGYHPQTIADAAEAYYESHTNNTD